MEAAPRLPMLSFDLKVNTEPTQFGPQLKQYIASFYHEDPEGYITEIHNLELLRATAVRPSMDVNGVQLLKKYYCQLHFLKSRFPMEENQDACVQFSWKNTQLDVSHSSNDINFELMAIMYNIGALHSYLGANESRNNPEGMKLACTHFQCAAWAFQAVKEKYHQFVVCISLVQLVHFFQQVCLAQAQECILEKSMLDNRKSTIVAKVAVQVHSYYRQSLSMLEATSEDLFRDRMYKEWTKYLQFKIAYYKCLSLLFHGLQAEEQQKMGERVAYYQAAFEHLEEAKKCASAMKNKQQDLNEGLGFTQDVVEGKRKAAKNENEFIYHEEVPDKDHLEEVKGASLVKGIPFSINDTEISGPDIFSRLVPMEAHEAASLYSEQKAQMLRQMGDMIETKDQALDEFMSSLKLDLLSKMHQTTGLPQEIIDRAASLAARPTATQDLIEAMGKLSSIYQDVEANLNEIDTLLKEEEESEKNYQELMGGRPPSIIATDLARENAKYREAHTKASESNHTLHRAMMAHIANLKILQQPLRQLHEQLPSINLPNENIDEKSLKELETLVSKVEEMRNQRTMLWNQLREAVHQDDITNALVTKQPAQTLDQLFQFELQKHKNLIGILEQNIVAQENIKGAIVDAYAKAINTRRYIQDILQKRESTISALVASFDAYEDLLTKASKGIDFYTKLESNVSKLLQRIKSASKVQQEERDQMLLKNDIPNPTATTIAPKLKDYLESRKKSTAANYSEPTVNYPTMMNYQIDLPPGIRPAPLGSEVTDFPKISIQEASIHHSNISNAHNSSYSPNKSQYTIQNNPEDDLVDRMNSLLSNPKSEMSTNQNPLYSYSSYTPPNYSQTTYSFSQSYQLPPKNVSFSHDVTKAYTTTTNSYKPLSSYSSPNDANTHHQYPEFNLNSTLISPSQPCTNYSTSGYSKPVPSPLPNNPQHNRNTYYPIGYAPDYQTNYDNTKIPQEPSQYHSVQYASSVQDEQPNYNYNTTYSSPLASMASAQATDKSYLATGYYTNETNKLKPEISNITNASDSFVTNYQYPQNYSSTSTSYSVSSSQATSNPYNYYTGNAAYSSSVPISSAYQSGYGNSSNSQAYAKQNESNYHLNSVSTQSDINNQRISYLHMSLEASQNQTYPQSSTLNQNAVCTQFDQSPFQSYQINNSTYPQAHATPINDSANYDSYRSTLPQTSQQSNAVTVQLDVKSMNTNAPYHNFGNAPNPPYQSHHSTHLQTGTTTPLSGNAEYASYGNYYGQNDMIRIHNNSNIQQYVPPTQQQVAPSSLATTCSPKESNIDLLSGLDFTFNETPLIPQQSLPKSEESDDRIILDTKITASNTSVEEENNKLPIVRKPNVKVLPSKSLNNLEVKRLFEQEIEKYEKFVETLTDKTLSGPTNLEIKWKEIQEKQDSDGQKKVISVARCYPLKNRFPDILPYDSTRVELINSKDDYINASFMKDVSPYAPLFIVTQAPLSSTICEFWTMVKEQQVELICCVMTDNEIGDSVYWPRNKGQDMSFLNMVISLKSEVVKTNWVERLISVNIPEKKETWVVMHLQFLSWPGRLFPPSPEPLINYTLELISLFQKQRSISHPVVVHCQAGIGRSGVLCLLTAAIMDATNSSVIPDIAVLALKLMNCHKNILRDREHLKFSYECFLAYMRQVTTVDKMKKKLIDMIPKSEEVKVDVTEVIEKNPDPLSTLDPFWASKKKI